MKPWFPLLLVVLLGVLVRAPFWAEALRTPLDGDTSIVGLMALHPGEGRTFWGQPHGSPLDSWLCMPFVAALGPTREAVRIPYFLLGLALIPAAYALGAALHPSAALPAALLMACPPAYFLLLSALPPPLYPSALLLCAGLLWLGAKTGQSLGSGERPHARLALWGACAGLALWTHLMTATAVAASGAWLLTCARGRRRLLAWALVPLVLASSPWWSVAVTEPNAMRVLRVARPGQTMLQHLGTVVPRLHEPLAGILGARVPLIADTKTSVVRRPLCERLALAVVYGLALALAAHASGGSPVARLLAAAAGLAVLAFPFPARSSPSSFRFLTPAYLPLLALLAMAPAKGRSWRGWAVVVSLALLNLEGGARLLAAWRTTARSAPPFGLADLTPARQALEQRGIRHAYASYGPAYRLTYESGESLVVSPPWNERFRGQTMPFLDEVRFAENVAWILTPGIPSDLPGPEEMEAALMGRGGRWQRTQAGEAVIYHGFVPPYGPTVERWPGAGPTRD